MLGHFCLYLNAKRATLLKKKDAGSCARPDSELLSTGRLLISILPSENNNTSRDHVSDRPPSPPPAGVTPETKVQ
jgi:hypothetical protein